MNRPQVEKKEGQRVRFFNHVTKYAFFNVEDALSIGKLKLIAGKYANGAATERVYSYIDVYDFMEIMDAIRQGIIRGNIERKFYTGSEVDGKIQSRVLSVKWDEKERVYWFGISNGPGKKSPIGAISPKGRPDSVVNTKLPEVAARVMAIKMKMIIQAWICAQMQGLGWMVSGYPAFEMSPGKPVDQTSPDQPPDADAPEVNGTGSRNTKHEAPPTVARSYANGETVAESNADEVEAYDLYLTEHEGVVPKNKAVLRQFFSERKSEAVSA